MIRARSIVGLMLTLAACAVFAEEPQPLSLKQAEELAVKNHPKITAADLVALAARQSVREARSAFYPLVTANATAAGVTGGNTRIAAGGLNNPLILDRDAEGIIVSQIITDFGRTANLTESAKSHSRAEAANALATRAQILLAVDSAYFSALQAQSVLEVARQTVKTRRALFDQVTELTKNKIRSGLDLSFASVNLDEANLLLAGASNDVQSANAVLANVLGGRELRAFSLVDGPANALRVPDPADLVETALRNRPDLARLRYEREAAARFARAEKDLRYPTISAVGTAGLIPVRDPLLKDHYAAAGVNLSVPIFDGMLFSARRQAAELQSRAVAENVRDEENNVIRDVRLTVLNRNYAADRMDLTAKLLASANEAFNLAQARYDVGSSSIVEFSQAQLNKTSAEIAQARAKFDYQVRDAIVSFTIGELGREP
jgi:outer membrane protein